MNRIPHVRGVRQALRALRKATQISLKGLIRLPVSGWPKATTSPRKNSPLREPKIREFQSGGCRQATCAMERAVQRADKDARNSSRHSGCTMSIFCRLWSVLADRPGVMTLRRRLRKRWLLRSSRETELRLPAVENAGERWFSGLASHCSPSAGLRLEVGQFGKLDAGRKAADRPLSKDPGLPT